ncbi:MAG TPA: hypothetical protein VKC64_07035, partial [Burkholderiales bacterium]|nr:hypothetical protein [Burkholderiales bacterium]
MGLRLALAVAWICIGAAAVLTVPAFAQAPQSDPRTSEAPPPAAPEPPPICAKCHKEAWEGLSQTKHAVRVDPRTPFGTGRDCQACHGDATEHLKSPTKNPMPQRFLPTTLAAEKSGVCLSCHAGNRHLTFWDSGRHAVNGVSCNNCHNLHAPPPPAAASALRQRDPTVSPYVNTIRQ